MSFIFLLICMCSLCAWLRSESVLKVVEAWRRSGNTIHFIFTLVQRLKKIMTIFFHFEITYDIPNEIFKVHLKVNKILIRKERKKNTILYEENSLKGGVWIFFVIEFSGSGTKCIIFQILMFYFI